MKFSILAAISGSVAWRKMISKTSIAKM